MMKLKHLFDNRDLTMMILSHWDYDPEQLDLLNQFRISANAVYPFIKQGKVHVLRFSPEEESTDSKILAELEFLRYLQDHGYPAMETVLSRRGKELEIIETPWGKYYAVVFKGVPGERLDRCAVSGGLVRRYGQALGRLHALSKTYKEPQCRRADWREQLQWMEKELNEYPHENAAREELYLLKEFLEQLNVNDANYGLVHYDFEPDNLFNDETTNQIYVIDFDDAVYHWFAIDIEQAITSMKEDMDVSHFEDGKLETDFMEGYRQAMPIADEMIALMPVFRRYADLYGFVRILRSLHEGWENEPDWMVNLRQHMNMLKKERSKRFGQSLP